MSVVPTSLNELRRPAAQEQPVVRAGFTDSAGFELMQRACKALAASTLVPKEYQGNLPNCIVAMEMAQRIGASPLMVMQNLYIVHGRPGWSAKFLVASFNQAGRFSAVRYEWRGERGNDDWGCRAWAFEKSTGERIEGPMISIALAKEEGWYGKSGSKWKTIPELMLMYRAAAWMINTHAPEISMGLNTAEEMHDVFDATQTSEGWSVDTVADLRTPGSAVVDESTGEILNQEVLDRVNTIITTGETMAAPTSTTFLEQIERATDAGEVAGALDMAREELTGNALKTVEAAAKAKLSRLDVE